MKKRLILSIGVVVVVGFAIGTLIPSFFPARVFRPTSPRCESGLKQLAKAVNMYLLSTEPPWRLHEAAKEGDLDCIKSYVKEGIPLNMKNRDGLTPLTVAERNGQKEVAEYLRAHGGTE